MSGSNRGYKFFEYSNHLGNVLTVTSDKKLYDPASQSYSAQVISASDYYPFGLAMYRRKNQPKNYRFGFNSKENDTEYGSSQLIQDYGFRIYNPSIGRFLSTDPLSPDYPELTPYQFAGNKPIQAIDLDGLETFNVHNYKGDNSSYLTMVKTDGPLVFRKNGLTIPLGSKARDQLVEQYNKLGYYVSGRYLMQRIKVDKNSLDPRHTYNDRKSGYKDVRVEIYKDIPNSSAKLTYEPTGAIRIPGSTPPVEYNNLETLSPGLIPNTIEREKIATLDYTIPRISRPPMTTQMRAFSFVNPDPSVGQTILGSSQAGWTNAQVTQRMSPQQVSAIVTATISQAASQGNTVSSIVIFRGRGTRAASAATANASARANVLLQRTQRQLQADNPGVQVQVQNLPAGQFGSPSIQINFNAP